MSMSNRDLFNLWHSGVPDQAAIVGDELYRRRDAYSQGIWAHSLFRLAWPALPKTESLAQQVDQLDLTIQGPESNWLGGRVIFDQIRDLRLGLKADEEQLILAHNFAELMAKFAHNSAGETPSFDASIGAELVSSLRRVGRGLGGLPGDGVLWEVMFHAGRGRRPLWEPYDAQWLISLLLAADEIAVAADAKGRNWAEVGPHYVRFVDAERPNQEGAAWKHQRCMRLSSQSHGEIVVDVLSNDRVGGVELLDSL